MSSCDAGHDAGRPCNRQAAFTAGRVHLCSEHLDVLQDGVQAEAANQAVYYARRYVSEAHGAATSWMEPKLAALLSEAEEEAETARLSLEHFLERAGDAPEEEGE